MLEFSSFYIRIILETHVKKNIWNDKTGIRRKQLVVDLKEKRKCWNLKTEKVDRTVCKTGFRRRYGSVVRQVT
jgi:hypothetical protein